MEDTPSSSSISHPQSLAEMDPSKAEMQVSDEKMYPDEEVSSDLIIDPKREAKLVRKLDLWIAPVMTIVFLTAYLDRSNIGNAASAGMTEDLGMSSGDLGSKAPGFQSVSWH